MYTMSPLPWESLPVPRWMKSFTDITPTNIIKTPIRALSTQSHTTFNQSLIIDSGCSPGHVVTTRMAPAFYADGYGQMESIQTAGPKVWSFTQRGTIKLIVHGTKGQPIRMILPEAIMSEAVTSDLISLSALVRIGYSAEFKQESAIITTPGRDKIRLVKDDDDM